MSRNYLLFMPSLIQRNDPPQIAYRSDITSEVYYGRQTNVPATLLVLNKLSVRGEKLNGIIMLCSDQVLNDAVSIEGKTQTTYEYYHDTIAAEMRKLGYSETEIDSAFVKFLLNEINPGSWSSMDKVQNEMLDLIGNDPSADETTLFVDYTGGLRSASMLLIFFSKLLESQGVKVEDVFYSNISRTEPGHGDIESCMDTYHVFDYLEAFITKDVDRIITLHSRDWGKDDLTEVFIRTKEAQEEIRRENYNYVTDADREAIPVSQGIDILQRLSIEYINKVRENLSVTGAIKESTLKRNVKDASQRIKEHGLEMIIKKGIISWKSSKYSEGDKKKKAFDAYASYYHSYIVFIQKMIKELDFSNREQLKADFKTYCEKHYALKPLPYISAAGTININYLIENEFSYCCRDHQKKLEDALIDEIVSCNGNRTAILDAVKKYQNVRTCYIGAYLGRKSNEKEWGGKKAKNRKKPPTSFPFANSFGSYTFTNVYGCKENDKAVWYDQEYKKALRIAIARFYNASDEVRMRSYVAVKDNIINQSRVFSPVVFPGLFTVDEEFVDSFGRYILLMDNLRIGRNMFTHEGENTSEEDESKMAEMIFEFLEWVE